MTEGSHISYEPRRPPRCRTIPIRGLDYHVNCWGDEDAEALVLLHGFMDTGSSFQFLADAMSPRWFLIAPDWRGFGKTQWSPAGYWFPDYLADLDTLLDAFSPGVAVNLLGHSMGGNVACLYAGIRPERIRRLISLEGFGLVPVAPGQAPERYRVWLDQQHGPRQWPVYESFSALAERLRERNPRLTAPRAAFVAQSWGVAGVDGKIRLQADPRHRLPNPVLYRREEAEACWRRVTAPVLLVSGADSAYAAMPGMPSATDAGQYYRSFEAVTLPGAGHMLHHDCPEAVAEYIERFLLGGPRAGK